MLKKIPYALIALAILVASCGTDKNPTDNSSLEGSIVLIFQDYPPDINTQILPNGQKINTFFDISYCEDNLQKSERTLAKGKSHDTLAITTSRNRVELVHVFHINKMAYYLLHKGDTVVFTYKNGVPYATITNRKVAYEELNHDIAYRERYAPNSLKGMNHAFLAKDPNTLNVDSIKTELAKNFTLRAKLIDSLAQNGLLSDEDALYRRRVLTKDILAFTRIDSAYFTPKVSSLMVDTSFYSNPDDSLVYYAYYTGFLAQKMAPYVEPIPLVKFSHGYKENYPARFDTISKLSFLSGAAKRAFLIGQLEGIAEEFSVDELLAYADKYIGITGDTATADAVMRKYNIDVATAGELLLTDMEGNSTDWQTVLDSHKGNVVYVDFWASWCAPCQRAMPEAKRLREEYKGSDVVFVYLAWKDEPEPWKKGAAKYETNVLGESYLITNPKTAKLLDELGVTSVPHYILYGKDGMLAHRNAPDAHGSEIRRMIDGLLAK